ncbi:hypothetical protein CM240_2885 [Clostridium bornimense]|uniref:DUF2935 domain-containing protein n=1 Tax=Clostridium bornimense TaxID=1216932 RepID=W6S6K4_9CLOT|nr:DUF2935 domain-containing protein [Clostridium bornimense]CDM70002.1 hypothetical protein CM240_2885 [Clostridium bornimense]
MNYYVKSSLELHLFFGRIMKEHSFFLEVGYTQANCNYIKEANKFKKAFEKLLYDVISCSEGIVDDTIFKAGEVITEYTLPSEVKTSHLTGSKIDENITKLEAKLWEKSGYQRSKIDSGLVKRVERINQRCLELLEGLISFKEQTLENVLQCKMFTMNYPLLIEHIIREAKLYQKYIMNLEEGNRCNQEDLREIELFWNQIMMEHALFIRGLLDPTENDLIMTADNFAQQYAKLLCDARNMTDRTISSVTDKTIEETIKYRDFKLAGTKGINDCTIRSLIVPLLADHVLREANHYIRLLEQK